MSDDVNLKHYRKKKLNAEWEEKQFSSLGIESIHKIIPHRAPILLLDQITFVDFEKEVISGSFKIQKDNPIFKGHFPEFPVYPGTLQIEMIGQLALCLYYFINEKKTTVSIDAKPVNIRATRVLSAQFTDALLPGETAYISAKKLSYDGFFATAIGQVVVGDKICSTAVGEVCFID